MAKFNVYSVQDKVKRVDNNATLHRFNGLFQVSSDDEFIRQCLFTVLMDLPLRDIDIYQVATFDDESGIITPCELRKLDLSNCYHIPKTTLSPEGEDLSLEELDKSAKDFKAKRLADLQSQIEAEKKASHK